jgi:hypothetical protein
VRQLLADHGQGLLRRQRLQASVLGWINHVRYGDTWGLRRDLLQEVRL